MRTLKEQFESYGGDYEETMVRFMGNEGLYLRLLTMFFQDENMKCLGDAIRKREEKAAFEAAHTLKGVTANMGLTPLYETVCVIVERLRAGENWEDCDYDALYQNIQYEYQRVEDLYKQLTESGEAS